MTPFRLLVAFAFAPAMLALAACGQKTDTAPAADTPIARVAPPAGKQWSDVVTQTADGGYLLGNPNAPLKLMEFGALSCSHCAAFSAEGFPKLRDTYVNSGRVSYELRFYLLGPLDLPAVLLTTCGGNTETVLPLAEQFWAWQPQMFSKLQAAGKETLQQIQQLPAPQRIPAIARLTGMTDFFAERGIATGQSAQCLADGTRANTLAAQTDKATNDFSITGTPAFFLNGRKVDAATWDQLEPALQKAGAR